VIPGSPLDESDSISLLSRLYTTPYRFRFFQAVRLLEHQALAEWNALSQGPRPGFDSHRRGEIVRFLGAQSCGKPTKYIGERGAAATANSELSAKINYIMCVSRFAH
jgi:hypothetical protein